MTRKSHRIYRDADTGEFTTERDADLRPRETVSETVVSETVVSETVVTETQDEPDPANPAVPAPDQ